MTNKKIWLGIPVMALVFGMTVVGCASLMTSNLIGPGNYWNGDVSMTKIGEASNQVWLNIFGTKNFPTAQEAAENGGITKIASVEHYIRPGIFGLFATYITVVTGE